MTFESALAYMKLAGPGSKCGVRRAAWPLNRHVHRETSGDQWMLFYSEGGIFAADYAHLFASDWEVWAPPAPRFEKVGNFQCALTTLKNGARVRRQTWDLDLWVEYRRPDCFSDKHRLIQHLHAFGGYAAIPWLPSADELLAEDWYRVLP